MKGLALDEHGDLLIENNQIQMLNDKELVRQTVERVLQTNKNEWFLNLDEGITFSNLLGKNKDIEIIKNEIVDGLTQVDSTFYIDSFEADFNNPERKLTIRFVAKNQNGDVIEEVTAWG